MGFIKKLATIKKKKKGEPQNPPENPSESADKQLRQRSEKYLRERDIAAQGSTKERLNLAGNAETHKEILYYLAEKDPDPTIRAEVANNAGLPLHASTLLARDEDEDVRMALARRLMNLLPDLSSDKHSQLYAFAVQALGTLALDEVLKIRIALSATLKDHAHTPPKVASQLARDVEREVSEPILRFCAALADEDLLDILRGHPADWVIESIAERNTVSEQVSEAVIISESRPGGTALIKNEGANITEIVLEQIVDRARDYPEWQKPLANRSALPVTIAKKLAEFVDASVRDLLFERADFDEEESEEIASIFRRRIDFVSEEETLREDIDARLDRLVKEDRLNDQTLSDALAMREYAFVVSALARIVEVTPEEIQRIMDARAPKSIVALCWKADVSMRLAFEIQKNLANIHHKNLIYPKDGTDYPLDEADILWQLEFLGL